MIKTILIVTIMVLNLNTVEQAYREELNYRTVERGRVSPGLARSWDADNVAGQDYLLMQAESREPVYLRFIHNEKALPYKAMESEGWNALEILVQDPDALAEKLRNSEHFSIVGEPRYLTEKQNIKAMQVLGPSGELIYLTNISDPEKSGFGLLPAKTYVDRVFIMVVGSKNMDELRDYYRNSFYLDVTDKFLYRIGVLSHTYGLPAESKHALSIAPISNRFLIELDQYPVAAKTNSRLPQNLPGGIAMVTFEVPSLGAVKASFLGKPAHSSTLAYLGRRSATLIGRAGEFIELVETSAPLKTEQGN